MTKLSIHTKLRKFYLSLLFTGVLTLINLNVLYIEQLPNWMGIFNLIYYLTVPGYLLTKVVRLKAKFGVTLGYSVVLSISFLIFLGFLINNLLPVFFIDRPLSRLPFVISANISIIVIYFLVLVHEDPFTIPKKFPKLKIHFLSFIFSFVAVLFPVLTALGSNLLNNGGSNIFNLIALFGIAIYVLMLIILRKNQQNYVFPFSIFFISLALLYMYSVRTPNLMGWDIHMEYKVFQLTKLHYQWTILNNSAYNATLGITILPTIFSNLIEIRDLYIFKIIYPFIFSFSCVGAFYIFKRYATFTTSYLATFFLIIQMGYFNMPSLARQEISYLAFTFIVLIIFDKLNSFWTKNFIFVILSSTMVVTHYTTTYIAVGLFVVTYLISKFIQMIYMILKENKHILNLPPPKFYLYGPNVIYVLLFTVFWYGIYTGTASNINSFFQSIQSNIIKIHTKEGSADQSWITITGKGRNSNVSDLEMYTNQFKKQYRSDNLYPESLISRYPIYQIPIDIIPYNKFLSQYPDLILLIIKQFMKILIIFGLLFLIYKFIFKKTFIIDAELIIFSSLYVLLILAAVFIPRISAQYNMERLYQQGLVFLAIIPVLLIIKIFPKINITTKYIFISIIFIYYFCGYNGLLNQFFGGYPKMNLNNYGTEYYEYYVRDSELTSVRWLNKERDLNSFLHADLYTRLRFAPESNILYAQEHLVPAAIWRGSYVYGSYENIVLGRVQLQYNNVLIMHNFPKEFLNDNKDVIYSNKINEISR